MKKLNYFERTIQNLIKEVNFFFRRKPLTSVILLSTKSSGSSAVQSYFTQHEGINHIMTTRHYENETLFWTKASSILGHDQVTLIKSEVPIDKRKAESDLEDLIRSNIKVKRVNVRTKKKIFHQWRKLCQHYEPVFFEKSPHHLFQKYNLHLIQEFFQSNSDIKPVLIGLVRNPKDIIYSYYKRWGIDPRQNEPLILEAFQNFSFAKQLFAENFHLIRYEDVVASVETLDPIFDKINMKREVKYDNFFNNSSVNKWKNDPAFQFNLSPELFLEAKKLGYLEFELL